MGYEHIQKDKDIVYLSKLVSNIIFNHMFSEPDESLELESLRWKSIIKNRFNEDEYSITTITEAIMYNVQTNLLKMSKQRDKVIQEFLNNNK
jgi:hypothetical protein